MENTNFIHSPFKIDTIEKDPEGFGLRRKEIIQGARNLYDNRSILISGPRGIGKSSLGYQLQNLYKDTTLLKRCGYEVNFPNTICCYKACSNDESLEQIVLDIICDIEDEANYLIRNNKLKIEVSLEFNLSIFKTEIKTEKENNIKNPATSANILARAIIEVMKKFKDNNINYGICIMIDEIDQLSTNINFGHFIKVIKESLNNKGINNVNFILAGQSGIYERLNKQDKSFERLVKHISLTTLDEEASKYIIYYAIEKCEIEMAIHEEAEEIILALSCGHPYIIHLIGDEAFFCMLSKEQGIRNVLDKIDVLKGVVNILKGDKKEKYISELKSLEEKEKLIILALADYSIKSNRLPYNIYNKGIKDVIPLNIPLKWIMSVLTDDKRFKNENEINEILDKLVDEGRLRVKKSHKNNNLYYIFTDELFRLFIVYTRLEKYEQSIREYNKMNNYLLDEEKYISNGISIRNLNRIYDDLWRTRYNPDFEEYFGYID